MPRFSAQVTPVRATLAVIAGRAGDTTAAWTVVAIGFEVAILGTVGVSITVAVTRWVAIRAAVAVRTAEAVRIADSSLA
ncbi:MAG: hypothetical protein ACLQFR_09365 [Streptosporangiaceae bacterium]